MKSMINIPMTKEPKNAGFMVRLALVFEPLGSNMFSSLKNYIPIADNTCVEDGSPGVLVNSTSG